MLGVIIGLVILLGVSNALFIFYVLKKSNSPADTKDALLLNQNLTTLNQGMADLKDGLQSHLTARLDKSNAQMLKQFETSATIIKDVTTKLTQLEKTNQQVGDIAGELKVLQNVLSNPKQRGVLGEFYLEQILQNMLPTGTYELQYRMGDGLIVDAVVKLDGKLLPIDSKFSLENYNRLREAKSEDRPRLEKAFKEDLKKRIDETAKYIQPKKGTLEQAFMFIPSEAIYFDLLANKVGDTGVNGRDLMQYAAVEKRVSVVGPSTLLALLQIVSQGLKSFEIQKDTEVIRKNVEQLGKHLHNVDGYFKRLGNSLGATVGHFNSTQKELGRVDKDVVKIANTTPSMEPLLLEKPQNDDELS
ncbi:MAG TPA: DNA recombination protein RmuC [Candidatus Saccharimonadales bacterium]|nr:DNA recombination protein RmuC [Candidatus Saccharimonadales bacterium]